MVSAADLPFAGRTVRGCVAIIYIDGVEYRLATYLGARIAECGESRLVLEQGKACLEVEAGAGVEHKLMAPVNGEMTKEIRERIVCGANIRFSRNGETLFEGRSEGASYEYVEV